MAEPRLLRCAPSVSAADGLRGSACGTLTPLRNVPDRRGSRLPRLRWGVCTVDVHAKSGTFSPTSDQAPAMIRFVSGPSRVTARLGNLTTPSPPAERS